ncbi:serine/threonine protein kinase [Streptomyces microflavus]|uniref:serine/threonine protein kinase n=1 Tax=Streptomyces microflavus TaxID=1919 RepID=UPI0033DE9972
MVDTVLDIRAAMLLNGRYRLEVSLSPSTGRAMGEVWKAQDVRMERTVVVKFPQLYAMRSAEAEERLKRFQVEAVATAQIRRDGVVEVHDRGEQDGHPFLVMEYIDGITLEDFMAENGMIDLSAAASVVVGVAYVLAAVHSLGIVHRDIKPSNIMIARQDGKVKVLDFGIARLEGGENDTRLTRTGAQLGTVCYMAPEQFRSERATAATDLYALGCIFYEMLAGRSVFDGPGAFEYQKQHLEQKPIPLKYWRPELPEDVLELVDMMLSKDLVDRPGTADEINSRLRGHLPKSGSEAPDDLIHYDPTIPFRNPCAPGEPMRGSRGVLALAETPPFRSRGEVKDLCVQARKLMLGDPGQAIAMMAARLPEARQFYGARDTHVLDLARQLAGALEEQGSREAAYEAYRSLREDTKGLAALSSYSDAAREGMRRCE